jgi:hypothetical protein
MRQNRWQDSLNALLGLWMFLSPWFLGFSTGMGVAARAAWILGSAVILVAAIAIYIPKVWEEGLYTILGLCLVVSPWMLSYADRIRPTGNAVIVGLLVIIFAVWPMLMDTTIRKWWHERHQVH